MHPSNVTLMEYRSGRISSSVPPMAGRAAFYKRDNDRARASAHLTESHFAEV